MIKPIENDTIRELYREDFDRKSMKEGRITGTPRRRFVGHSGVNMTLARFYERFF